MAKLDIRNSDRCFMLSDAPKTLDDYMNTTKPTTYKAGDKIKKKHISNSELTIDSIFQCRLCKHKQTIHTVGVMYRDLDADDNIIAAKTIDMFSCPKCAENHYNILQQTITREWL